jgi:antitoxin VapB
MQDGPIPRHPFMGYVVVDAIRRHAYGSVFQSNRSQAIRLPKAGALLDDVKRVDIVAVERTRIIVPAGEIWGSWFKGAETTSDFMTEREQAASQEREYMLDQEFISLSAHS